ncbi:hypothetical protein [Phytoactinopolyspora limicola]|uniref:hypothetical protein n=1 Tax=Phytoactinopolyspora limicola TaxID=2715536 RepID=UPI00140B9002|nr:hypothetical protein [Phytoactinopolyspora limicola]
MKEVTKGQIAAGVEAYLREDVELSASRRRERSWDFCFNHFQEHSDPTKVMELSCLHLGYYLASWGMLRGSTFLFRQTNVMHYRRVVEVIATHNATMRGCDVDAYRDTRKRQALEDAWRDIRLALLPDGGNSRILISKVMMGVWGCLPSFDTYFVRGFRGLGETKTEKVAFNRVSPRVLDLLAGFYERHAEEIDSVRHLHTTWDMSSGRPTGRPLTRAKILDIYGFHTAFAS